MTQSEPQPEPSIASLIEWDPLIPGIPKVKLMPMQNGVKAEAPHTIPVKIVRCASLEKQIREKIIMILMDPDIPTGHEVNATLWLENELDHACSRVECHEAVKKIRKAYRTNDPNKGENIIVRLCRLFWVDEATYEILRRVPGTYRIDRPGESQKQIETTVKMPSSQAIAAMAKNLEYDDFLKDKPREAPGSKGTLVQIDSKPIPKPGNMRGPMPGRDGKGRRSL